MTKIGTFVTRFRSLLGKEAAPAQKGMEEKLDLAHEELAEKNRRLKRFREQVERDQQEIETLRSELVEAGIARTLPAFSKSDAPVFFVLGQGKSGTTWLMNTLNSHPEILCRGEGRFFERGFNQMVGLEHLQAERLKTVQPSSLYSAISSSEHLRTWIERSVWTEDGEMSQHLENLTRLATNYFLTDRLSKTDKKIVGDKTTFSRGEALNEIAAMHPEAKVIHIVRDGRDVAVSMIHHMWNHAKDVGGFYDLGLEELGKRDTYRRDPQAALAEGLFIEKRLRNVARAWADHVGNASDHGPILLGENYVEVRYEDLLDRPEKELGKLLRFVGADDAEETVRNCIETNRFENWAEGRGKGQEESSSFYRKGVAGDWRNVFTEKDKQIFKEMAGDLLIELGYEENEEW